MPNYADLTSVVANETDKAVLLSGQSIALLFTALGELNYWTGSGDFGRLTDAERDAVDAMVSRAERELMSEVQVTDYKPDKMQFWHYQSRVMVGNALIYAFSSTLAHNFYLYQNPAANGDIWESPHFSLAGGSYRVVFMVAKTSVSGICQLYFNGTQLAQEDLYAAAGVNNHQLSYTVNIGDSDDNWFSCQVVGKNASSTGYRVPVTSYWIERL